MEANVCFFLVLQLQGFSWLRVGLREGKTTHNRDRGLVSVRAECCKLGEKWITKNDLFIAGIPKRGGTSVA